MRVSKVDADEANPRNSSQPNPAICPWGTNSFWFISIGDYATDIVELENVTAFGARRSSRRKRRYRLEVPGCGSTQHNPATTSELHATSSVKLTLPSSIMALLLTTDRAGRQHEKHCRKRFQLDPVSPTSHPQPPRPAVIGVHLPQPASLATRECEKSSNTYESVDCSSSPPRSFNFQRLDLMYYCCCPHVEGRRSQRKAYTSRHKQARRCVKISTTYTFNIHV